MPEPLTLSATCALDALEAEPLISSSNRLLCEVKSGSATADAVGHFIRRRFAQAYGAKPELRIPRLLALTTSHGSLLAAVGVRGADEERLFLEDYLDLPVELAIPGGAAERAGIAEITHLAGVEAGVSRYLFASLCLWIQARAYQWIAFTATHPLCHAFERMGLQLHPLAAADPARLADGGRGWGSYYEQSPMVIAINVEAGLKAMEQAGFLRSSHWLNGCLDKGADRVLGI